MKYQKTVNLWSPRIESALRAGIIKLQSGQPVYCGSDVPSVFDSVCLKTGHIRAFHGKTYAHAQAKYKTAKKMDQLNDLFKAGKISLKVMRLGFAHASKRYQPVK